MEKKTHLSIEDMAMAVDLMHDMRYSELPEDIRIHLKECDECALELLSLSEISSGEIYEVLKNDPKPSSGIRRLSTLAKIAAVLVLALGVYFLFFQEPRKQEPLLSGSSDTILFTDTTSNGSAHEIGKKNSVPMAENQINEEPGIPEKEQPHENDLLAFAENKNLESLYDRYESNSEFRSMEFTMISPHEIILPKPASVKISWKFAGGTCQVVLLDNEENEVEMKSGSESVLFENISSEGLFYYKILDPEFNLLYCGKIVCGKE